MRPARAQAWCSSRTGQVSLYASAGKSFRPNSGIGINNESFPAETSRSYETGIKFDSADGKLSSTLALYSIRKQNVLTLNPLDTNFSLAAARSRQQGRGAGRGRRGRAQAAAVVLLCLHRRQGLARQRAGGRRCAGQCAEAERQPAAGEIISASAPRAPRWAAGSIMSASAMATWRSAAPSGCRPTPRRNWCRLTGRTARLRLSLDVDNLFDKVYYPSVLPANVGRGRRRPPRDPESALYKF
jgi:iron complex outermembrane receptor protein